MDNATKPVRPRLKKAVKLFSVACVGVFALVGLVFTGVFAAMQFGLLNVRGSIASRNQYFSTLSKTTPKAVLGSVAKSQSPNSCVSLNPDGTEAPTCEWNSSPEWAVVKAGISKDATVINKVSQETDIPSRMIAASVAPEQLRLFTSDRENYKKYFEPLKVLGSMSQFSLGVAGFKQNTAAQVERNLVDTNSPFFPGEGLGRLVAYAGGIPQDQQLYSRLTDSKDHYYSYLYTALYLKEIEAQWSKSGYDISERPDILVTLFNESRGRVVLDQRRPYPAGQAQSGAWCR
jgi:hypothetical protein